MNMMETLRKFGLGYCDLPTMMWNVTVLLRALTLNIDKRYTKRIPVIFYILTIVISLCYFYVYLVSVVWFVFVKCPQTGEVVSALIGFSLGISSEIGTAKLFYMFLNIKLINNIVEGYSRCHSNVVPGSRFANNIEKTLKIVKKRAIIFWVVIIFNGIAYCAKPFLLPGRHLMDDSLIIFGLEPMYQSPNYEIAYFVSMGGVIFTCYLPANITALIIVITGYTEAQMLALSEEIKHLYADAQECCSEFNRDEIIQNEVEFKNKAINKFIKKELTEIVKKHTININLIRQIENVFRGAIAIEFTLLIMGLIAELLGGLENTYIQVPYALMQVAMDCLVGQRLIDASVAFENAVYDSKWENFDHSNMKTVFIILQNSQKTMKLSAGGVTTLSFASLMSVLKSIYSAYTALHSSMK